MRSSLHAMILDAEDRKRFPARSTPPGAVVPRLLAKGTPWWDGWRLAALILGRSREDRETWVRGEGDAEDVLWSDLRWYQSRSGVREEDFDPRVQH